MYKKKKNPQKRQPFVSVRNQTEAEWLYEKTQWDPSMWFQNTLVDGQMVDVNGALRVMQLLCIDIMRFQIYL